MQFSAFLEEIPFQRGEQHRRMSLSSATIERILGKRGKINEKEKSLCARLRRFRIDLTEKWY